MNHSHRAVHKISTRDAASLNCTPISASSASSSPASSTSAALTAIGGSGGSGAGSAVGPNRRLAHILSEQKRREKINGGFDVLKSVIPE